MKMKTEEQIEMNLDGVKERGQKECNDETTGKENCDAGVEGRKEDKNEKLRRKMSGWSGGKGGKRSVREWERSAWRGKQEGKE